MKNDKFEIIEPNAVGRRRTVRFKQYEYEDKIEGSNWTIQKNGCGPVSLATILASLGFLHDPISIAKIMLFNEHGFLSDGYYVGINGISILYCLNKLIEDGLDLEYRMVKINYDKPELMKEKIQNMIEDGYMAILNIGPGKNSFASEGHYIVVTSLNRETREFYVANGWYDGDEQIDKTFSYELLVNEIYKDNFDFLMIKRKNS